MASWVMGKGKGQQKEKRKWIKEWKRRRRQYLVCSLVLLSALASNENSTFGPLRGSSVFRLIRPIITQHMTQSWRRKKKNQRLKKFNESNYILKINYPVRIFGLVTSTSEGKLFLVNFHARYYLFWIYILRELRSSSWAQVALMLPVCTKYDHRDRYSA